MSSNPTQVTSVPDSSWVFPPTTTIRRVVAGGLAACNPAHTAAKANAQQGPERHNTYGKFLDPPPTPAACSAASQQDITRIPTASISPAATRRSLRSQGGVVRTCRTNLGKTSPDAAAASLDGTVVGLPVDLPSPAVDKDGGAPPDSTVVGLPRVNGDSRWPVHHSRGAAPTLSTSSFRNALVAKESNFSQSYASLLWCCMR
jgi:hypothetical protein